MGATTRKGLVDAARRAGPRRLGGCSAHSAGSALVVTAVLAALLGGTGAPGPAAAPAPPRAVPVSQVTVLPTGSSSNGGCQFNNNTINSGPGFDGGDLPFRSGLGYHRQDVPFLGLIITDLMRRCLDQVGNRGGGFSHRGSDSDD